MDLMIVIAQMVSAGFLAGWLTTGILDNLRYPDVNEAITAEVMEMARIRQDFPAAYAPVAHRRITSRTVQKAAFRIVVIWELLATLVLWAGALALALSLFGFVAVDVARIIAMAGTLMFTAVWAGFLIVGNHFCYWFGHEGAQNTHFQMTLWGTLSTLILMAG